MTPLAQRTSESGTVSLILEPAIYHLSYLIRAAQGTILTDIFYLVYLRFG